jgi:hypothetical protein
MAGQIDWSNLLAWPIVKHTIQCSITLACFKIIGLIAIWATGEGRFVALIEGLEHFVLFTIFVWFSIQLAIELWNRRIRLGSQSLILA